MIAGRPAAGGLFAAAPVTNGTVRWDSITYVITAPVTETPGEPRDRRRLRAVRS